MTRRWPRRVFEWSTKSWGLLGVSGEAMGLGFTTASHSQRFIWAIFDGQLSNELVGFNPNHRQLKQWPCCRASIPSASWSKFPPSSNPSPFPLSFFLHPAPLSLSISPFPCPFPSSFPLSLPFSFPFHFPFHFPQIQIGGLGSAMSFPARSSNFLFLIFTVAPMFFFL